MPEPFDLDTLARQGAARRQVHQQEARSADEAAADVRLRVAVGALQQAKRGSNVPNHVVYTAAAVAVFGLVTDFGVVGWVALLFGVGIAVIAFSNFIVLPADDAALAAERARIQALPYRLHGYEETLGLPPTATCKLSLQLRFVADAPPAQLVADVCAAADPGMTCTADEHGVTVVTSAISGYTGVRVNKVPIFDNRNHAIAVDTVIERVLRPLHSRYPIAEVTLAR